MAPSAVVRAVSRARAPGGEALGPWSGGGSVVRKSMRVSRILAEISGSRASAGCADQRQGNGGDGGQGEAGGEGGRDPEGAGGGAVEELQQEVVGLGGS